VVEVVAAAETGSTRRASVQRHLAAQGLRPDVLRTVGLLGQSVGALRSRNTRFDDHPLRNRIRGRLAFVLESSLSACVKRVDPFCARLEFCAGVPLGEPCPETAVVANT